MAPEHVLEALREQQVERLAQAEQQVLGRRAAVLLVMLLAFALGPVPVARAQSGAAVGVQGVAPRGDEAETRRGHQALLRAGDGDVHPPGVHVERHGRERGDGVDHQERVVAGRIDRLTDRRNVVDGARRGVDLNHQDGLDPTRPVGAQIPLERRRIDGAAGVAGQGFDLQPEHARHVAPDGGEQAALQHEHGVAPGQHVDQRRLPGAVAVRGIDVDPALGAEHPARSARQLVVTSTSAPE